MNTLKLIEIVDEADDLAHSLALVPAETLEKFAELIVKECAQIAKEVDGDEGDDYQSGRTWAGIDVLKHFGVE